MIYETITQEYIDEYGSIFKGDSQTPDSIKNAFDALRKKHTAFEIDELDSKLFGKNSNDNVRISGERNINANLFRLPTYVNSTQIGLSNIDLLEAGLRFINLYDLDKSNYKERVLPLLIIFVCLKTNRFLGDSSISYKNGVFSVSFSSSVPFSKSNCAVTLKNNIMFDFFEQTKIITMPEILASFPDIIFADTTDGYWHSYMLLLNEEAQKTCVAKTRFWLSCYGELTRKEIVEITKHQHSERSINDALHKLIEEGEVMIIGNANSPIVKYKYIGKDEKYI